MAILILIVAMGMGALVENKELAIFTEQLYEHSFKASNNLLEANERIEEMRICMGKVVTERSDQKLDALVDQLHFYETRANDLFLGVIDTFSGDQADVLSAYRRFKDWEPRRTQIIRFIRASKYDEARILNQGSTNDNVDKLSNELSGLIDFTRSQAKSFVRDSKQRQYEGRIFILSAIVAVILLMVTISVGITERDRDSRRELLESESQFRELYEKTPVMLHSSDKQGRVTVASGYWLKNLGYSRDNVIGRPLTAFLSDESRRLFKECEQRFQETGEVKNLELDFVRSNGEIRVICLSASAKYGADGSFVNSQCVLEDITERRHAEATIRKSEARLNEAQRIHQVGSWEIDSVTNAVYWSDEVYRIYGLEPQEFSGSYESFLDSVRPDDREFVNNAFTELVKNRTPQDIVHRMLLKDGTLKFINRRAETFYDDAGEAVRSIGTVQDITKQLKAEQALEESKHLLSVAIDNMAVGIVVIKEDGTISEFNSFAEQVFGYETAEVVGKNIRMLMPEAYWNECDQSLRTYLRSATDETHGIGQDATGIRKNGETFPMRIRVGELQTADGSLFVGTIHDLTEIKRLEGQLRQSQKMDAIGQLTGGIAHDFNNIIGIVMGNLELLQSQVASDAKTLKSVNSALKGAERGASLTRKLLGFSRKSAAEVKLTNVNDFIKSLHGLIAKSLTPSIAVEEHLAADLWPVEIDPGDFEDVLLNLSLNARDAMPNGGALVIETANKTLDEEYIKRNPKAPAGEFVTISVSDTGSGMTDEVREKIFEPFFTTRDRGKGTGLGLSMVYGFVQRSRGYVKVYSEIGEGTTFYIYLPRAQEKAPSDEETIDISDSVPGGNETILIVDDEVDLMDVAVAFLEGLGYKTLRATGGKQALKILEENEDIDLLFSDVIMPGGLDGFKLALAAMKILPTLKILLTSGLTRRHQAHANGENAAVVVLTDKMLHKPYNESELATAIRNTLDNKKDDET
jgi:PAS domain S-box-containing protein